MNLNRMLSPKSPPAADIIKTHTERALKGLPESASAYDKVAALNAYIHLTLERENGSTARSAEEVLESGRAICGGMSLALSRMVEEIGLKAEFAFTYGGLAAHSMVEVFFDKTVRGLFDPYHGLTFYSDTLRRPLSIVDIQDHLEAVPAPVFYVRRSGSASKPLTRENVYSSFDEDMRKDFAFPEMFTAAHGVGLANSGLVSHINIEMQPSETLGDTAWSRPSKAAPRPWSALAEQRRDNGEYVSWAYLLGTTSLGYRVEHVYSLSGLDIGRRYRLRLKAANIYSRPDAEGDRLALTLQPVAPFGKSRFYALDTQGYVEGSDYTPLDIDYMLTAESETATLLACSNADMVLQSISLELIEE